MTESALKVADPAYINHQTQYSSIENYWLNKFSGELTKSYFPYDRQDIKNRPYMEEENMDFPGELVVKLMKLCNQSFVRLHLILLTGVILLLNKYTGNNDIIVAVPVYKQETEGELINTTLALRNEVTADTSFKNMLLQVRQTVAEAVENQSYPIELLINHLEEQGFDKTFFLFDTAILLENIHERKYLRGSILDMIFSFFSSNEGIRALVGYNARLYERNTIKRIGSHLINLLEQALSNPDLPISNLEILGEQEKKQLLLDFNDTETPYPDDKTLIELFKHHAEKNPGKIAVIGTLPDNRDIDKKSATWEPIQVTYRELQNRVNRLVPHLKEKGASPHTITAILMNRSIHMLEGIMAVWQSGSAYLPIDPDYPQDRIDYILTDSNAKILLTSDAINRVPTPSSSTSTCQVGRANLAYIIYTSGSTGKPKGAMVEHRGMMNHIRAKINDLKITAESIVAQNASHTFDISVWQFFASLTRGGKTVIYPGPLILEPHRLISRIIRDRVTLLEVVPSYLVLLLDSPGENFENSCLEYLLVTGEVLKPNLVKQWFARYPAIKMVNAYGPTEASDDITHYFMETPPFRERVPIGKPLQNLKIYILDENKQLCPIGIKGEICVSGVGVGRGYLNNPELTAQKFDHDLWDFQDYHDGYHRSYRSNRSYITHLSYYKTGDLGRWLPDGTIDFLGRKDDQVKVRGFRIQLGEIENQLMTHEQVKETVVTLNIQKENNNEKQLCAYIVCNKEIGIPELREYLSGKLPHYMIPAYFMILEKLPLTANGKVNRQALPAPDNAQPELNRDYIAPRNDIEQIIVNIWSDVLGIEKIGVADNFFQLGGHSVNAVSIITRINKELDTKLALSVIFDFPTTAELVAAISTTPAESKPQLLACPPNDYYQLSHSQKRLWFFKQIEPNNPAYHIPMNLRLTGPLNTLAFESTINLLIQRHESLRTSFQMIEPQQKQDNETGMEEMPIQIIHQQINIDIHQKDISNLSSGEKQKELSQVIKTTGIAPFDLTRAPLFRVALIKMAPQEHIVVFIMHHIICDAFSLQIMANEFAYLYNQSTRGNKDCLDDLPGLPFQYKDFAYWQNQLLTQGQLNTHKDYWHKKLEGELPLLDLPYDYSQPSAQNPWGDKVTINIDERLTQKIKKLARKTASTLFMILEAAFKVLLYRYTRQEDIIIGTLTAGRSTSDLDNIIGYFINILAIRDTLNGQDTFADFLVKARKTMLEAFDHQDYPFDKLVEELKVKRDLGRTPVFDIMLVFQYHEDLRIHWSMESLKITGIEKDYVVNKYDLYLDIIELPGGVTVDFEFRTDLYKKETIQRMVQHYVNILDSITLHPEQPIAKIDMMDEEEKKKLLTEFNDTARDFPRHRCFHHLFQEQVTRTPDKTAARHQGKTITYKELNEKANQLAGYLTGNGIRANQIVGLFMNRSIGMLISIIGVFKAGGAYLPIETDYPKERIRFMIQHAEVRVLLTDPGNIEKPIEICSESSLPGQEPIRLLCPEGNPMSIPRGKGVEIDDLSRFETNLADNRESHSITADYAYLIYTSGTTGQPKGVPVHQLGMINHLYAKIHDLDINGNDRIAQTASPCFDISVWQMLAALLQGGTTIIFDYHVVLSPGAMLLGLQQEKITIFETVPSLLTVFLEMPENETNIELKHLEWLIATGEPLTPALVKQWFHYYPHIKMVNAYGPTEASDDITHHVIYGIPDTGQFSVPIGKPLQNMRIYILDQDMMLCPPGVRGEICTAGLGVVKGYWKDPEKTSRVLVANPYAPGAAGLDYGTLYKTGDIGYFQGDGTIICLGRIDNQVKIRGFRIELEEIETMINKHPDILQCAALTRKKEGIADSITAFLKTKETIDLETLKGFLLQYLPPFMIPSRFVKVAEFPLTISGKIDRQALAALDIDTGTLSDHLPIGGELAPPRSDSQKQIARIWSKTLDINLHDIGIYDNFFDLGGHSLIIPRIHRELEKQFPGKFEIPDLFEYMTIHDLSRRIETKEESEDDEVIRLIID